MMLLSNWALWAREVGSVTEDRGAGIAGVSGVISPGIPSDSI